ncbi:hypothetical protein Tsubulata_006156 [Turnera subulata]|uniref:Growth-regulating factor n=1 Tax=Turnera subulata TaxID=218843 RepID=A0A9Q0FSQ7_9ROSI|nr:hypothetical protein Tsubulata_006156 [Turnera subulata]
MTAEGFSFTDKATKEGNTNSNSDGVVVQLGVNLQQQLQQSQSFPFNTCMMIHQLNRHRSLPSDGPVVGHGPTGDGIISSVTANDHIYRVVGDGAYGAAVAGCGGGAAVGLRTLQPFDISSPALNSPGGMAASLGFPFTNAQWNELERQAIIYKYMMASIPVPPYLLSPTPKNLSSGPAAAAYSPNLLGSVLNLRFTNGADPEPGRCRRTDGKKWRCSRDVAPDQKYCERHMNRGRPRSRKPVEVHANNKKARHSLATCAEPPVTLAVSNPTLNGNATASQFAGAISRPYLHNPAFLDKSCDKVSTFDVPGAYVSRCKEPRNLDWMMKGEPVPIATSNHQWNHLVETETEIGLATDTSFNDASVLSQHYQEEPLSLNSLGNFSAGADQRNNQCTLFPRGFIDAWSRGASNDHNTNSRNTNSLSSNGKPRLSSLTLSMGGNKSMDDDNDEMGQIQMGLGLMESDQNHHECGAATTTPGGPLAEALKLTTFSSTTSQCSSGSPRTTSISSPSGVLQKALASFSDSSGNSSPTPASSRSKHEMPLMWLSSG